MARGIYNRHLAVATYGVLTWRPPDFSDLSFFFVAFFLRGFVSKVFD